MYHPIHVLCLKFLELAKKKRHPEVFHFHSHIQGEELSINQPWGGWWTESGEKTSWGWYIFPSFTTGFSTIPGGWAWDFWTINSNSEHPKKTKKQESILTQHAFYIFLY